MPLDCPPRRALEVRNKMNVGFGARGLRAVHRRRLKPVLQRAASRRGSNFQRRAPLHHNIVRLLRSPAVMEKSFRLILPPRNLPESTRLENAVAISKYEREGRNATSSGPNASAAIGQPPSTPGNVHRPDCKRWGPRHPLSGPRFFRAPLLPRLLLASICVVAYCHNQAAPGRAAGLPAARPE